jgi:hypothetical protein
MTVRCPKCGAASPFEPVQLDQPRTRPPEPSEPLTWRTIPVLCVQPVPVSRQLRRALARSGGPPPVCGERFLVRIA